ncbi:MAG: AAA family ATPase [Acidobacteriota bacterium]
MPIEAQQGTRFQSWDIRDLDGKTVARHTRTDFRDGSKTYRWFQPDGKSGLAGRRTEDLPLYLTETLRDFAAETPVVVVEGEKAADVLKSHGFLAVGTVTGAPAAPSLQALEAIRDRLIYLWPDFDDVGRSQAEKIVATLRGRTQFGIHRIEWGTEDGNDAADFFARGGTEDQLDRLLAEAPLVAGGEAVTLGVVLTGRFSNCGPEDRSIPADGRIVSIDTFMNETPSSEPSVMGDGVIAEESLNVLAGEEGMSKTAFETARALHLAAGIDFLGIRIPKSRRVLFLEAEGNRDYFRQRIADAAEAYGIEWQDLPIWFAKRKAQFVLGDESVLRAVADCRAEYTILDTIGLFHDGDENSNTDWKRHVVKPSRRIIRETGTAFGYVHHFSKPSQERKGGNRIRGAKAVKADSDTVLTLEPAEKYGPTARVLKFEKIKNGPPRQAMVLSYNGSANHFILSDKPAAVAFDPRLAEVADLVMGVTSKAELVRLISENLGVGRSTAEVLIKSAVDSDLISKLKRGEYGPRE